MPHFGDFGDFGDYELRLLPVVIGASHSIDRRTHAKIADSQLQQSSLRGSIYSSEATRSRTARYSSPTLDRHSESELLLAKCVHCGSVNALRPETDRVGDPRACCSNPVRPRQRLSGYTALAEQIHCERIIIVMSPLTGVARIITDRSLIPCPSTKKDVRRAASTGSCSVPNAAPSPTGATQRRSCRTIVVLTDSSSTHPLSQNTWTL